MFGLDISQIFRSAVDNVPALKPLQGIFDMIENAKTSIFQAIMGMFKKNGLDIEAPVAMLTGLSVPSTADPQAARLAANGVANPGVAGGDPASLSQPQVPTAPSPLSFFGIGG